ncbi:HAUS augmin-like complex subunit 6 N-terminus-domain-containing protein [Pseudoneurospora amorphoporcata]|uniref:HAUS augmin-like complex subunit 6 N-terminus-domain-containing protein n=1 Tax=Pseudoneurospora amorphoporcata TaxID=241081 RepID=A0AAN6NY91_9PEZI|nr:HAUS augmin-like complex subunit 6 N-terminus-domain-containing protein [Pseudoneurospora amorphoporcata]
MASSHHLSSNVPRAKTVRSTGTSNSSLNKPIGFSRSIASATSHASHTTHTSSITSATGPPSTTNPTPNTSNTSNISNISLFLTNLRLLDLDLLPDWPDINAVTFSVKDAARGQKKRIQCVEWALFQLFNLWDHQETRNKLKPFFPPLENVQSLNLRAALVRSLEQAKKNGVLGRDAIVRKTMLDECKGDRLEEILAVFSSAVLKKVVAEQQRNDPRKRHPALAQALALEHLGYSGDRSELTALIVAHRASLCRSLKDKKVMRERLREFSEMLKIKEQAIADRRQRAQASQRRRQNEGKEISHEVKLDVWRTVRNNWSGNERWLETLLHGDQNTRKDGVLSAPFDRVWRRVQAGRISELEDKSDSLLDELDDRVKSQEERLQRWQTFRQQTFGKTNKESITRESMPKPKLKGIDLGLRGHEALHRSRTARRRTLLNPIAPNELQGDYKELLRDFKLELSRIDPKLSGIPSWLQKLARQEYDAEVISDISDHERNLVAAPSRTFRQELTAAECPSYQTILERLKSVHEQGEALAQSDDINVGASTRPQRPATLPPQYANDPEMEEGSSRLTRNQQREEATNPTPAQASVSPPRRRPSFISRKEKQPERLLSSPASSDGPPSPLTEEGRHGQYSFHPSPEPQQLADQILASVDAASPSPLRKPRHTLSLAERTRLTLARRHPQGAQNAEADADADEEDAYFPSVRSASHKRSQTISSPYKASTPGTPDATSYSAGGGTGIGSLSTYEDLETRTRRSMANFESAQKKAQLERQRSERKSKQLAPPPKGGGYFPAVGEEGEDAEGNSALLLAEELLSAGQDVDYDAVFRSRPKIAMSPPLEKGEGRFRGWE